MTDLKPYQVRKKAKLCVRGCGRKADKGKSRCWRCRDKQNAYNARRREEKSTADVAMSA